jgi:hypothetical protein
MDHLQPARVDPRKQALLEARFGSQNKVYHYLKLVYDFVMNQICNFFQISDFWNRRAANRESFIGQFQPHRLQVICPINFRVSED